MTFVPLLMRMMPLSRPFSRAISPISSSGVNVVPDWPNNGVGRTPASATAEVAKTACVMNSRRVVSPCGVSFGVFFIARLLLFHEIDDADDVRVFAVDVSDRIENGRAVGVLLRGEVDRGRSRRRLSVDEARQRIVHPPVDVLALQG